MSTRLQAQAKPTTPIPSFTPVRSGLLQRKCACGGTPGPSGECEECRKKRLQRKACQPSTHYSHTSEVPPIVHEVLRSPGQPLDSKTLAFMGPRFGHDFSEVRMHTDAKAADSTQAVKALGYTVGRHVVFGSGRYAPETMQGSRLLTHELTHTIQQSGALARPTGDIPVGSQDSHFEVEADATADGLSKRSQPVWLTPSPVSLRKQAQSARAAPPARAVIAIRLGHSEAGGLGRFDTLLYRDCAMKVQFRMNFNFLGPWPRESDKRDWQNRFISTVSAAWSRNFDLEAAGECRSGCARVSPFVEIYAPHAAPHVTVDVTYTGTAITSSAGGGVAHLDSLDLTPTKKGSITEQQRRVEGVAPQVPATHEFGHLIGRPDRYVGAATCAPGYPMSGVMCFGNAVTVDDYQPFANALNAMTGCAYNVVPRRVGDFPTPASTERAA